MAAIPFMARETRTAGEPTSATAPQTASTGVCRTPAKPAPLNYTIKDMDGHDVRLADYKGKVIVLNFWATWCGPCQYEIPDLIQLQQKYRDKGLVLLGASVDDEAETLKAYAREKKMNYTILMDRENEDLQRAYGPMVGIPTTFVIGRDGTICTKYMGPRTLEQFERDIKALL